MYRSISTIKADAARRSYASLGEGITWAVIGSGIDARHPHFQTHDTLGGHVAELHRDFTGAERPAGALNDEYGYSTHGAGIIAGGLPADLPEERVRVFERVYNVENPKKRTFHVRSVEPGLLTGIAPRSKLVSLKVFDEDMRGSLVSVIQALEYIRTEVNHGGLLRVHGVDLSVGYQYDTEAFACGQSPLCIEVDRLVQSGVVVVVSAGNTGYGSLTSLTGSTDAGFLLTINDPGNAELAITVGSTHKERPHRYGISYFSSKGPTLDGRLKPDLVAPGEDIASCATGKSEQRLRQQQEGTRLSNKHILYGEETGTTMATAHVSGAVAAFLSVHREFIGRPHEVKRIFLETATSLGRRPEFQGRGLVDLMRALQHV